MQITQFQGLFNSRGKADVKTAMIDDPQRFKLEPKPLSDADSANGDSVQFSGSCCG